MSKSILKIVVFLSIGFLLVLGLSRISERYPVSVREQIFGMVVERALTEVFSARAADFEALVVGCSHGRGIDLDRMGFVGVNLSMPWLDLFEIDYQLRALLPRLPKVRTVFIAVPYFAFSWDNSLIRDSQLLISRRLFYYHAPFFSFMPGDYENFIKGKLWRLLRPDHWEHVILLTKPVVVTGESGEIIEAILSDDPGTREEETKTRVDETMGYRREMNAKDPNIRERTFATMTSLIDFLSEMKIRTVFFTPPYYFKYTEHCGKEVSGEMHEMMGRLVNAGKTEYYDFSADPDFIRDAHYFANCDHLNVKGIRLFSQKLKETVAKG